LLNIVTGTRRESDPAADVDDDGSGGGCWSLDADADIDVDATRDGVSADI
jgi:hypothetical protein